MKWIPSQNFNSPVIDTKHLNTADFFPIMIHVLFPKKLISLSASEPKVDKVYSVQRSVLHEGLVEICEVEYV